MKITAAAILATLLLVATCSSADVNLSDLGSAASSQEVPGTIPSTCCLTYIRRPIPHRMLISAYKTSSACTLPAVILVTNKGRQLCADPEMLWVKKYLKRLQILQK